MTSPDLLNTLVSDLLSANPAAARVFIDRGMGCVGCTFAPFDTVADAAYAYNIEPGELVRALARTQVYEPAHELCAAGAPEGDRS